MTTTQCVRQWSFFKGVCEAVNGETIKNISMTSLCTYRQKMLLSTSKDFSSIFLLSFLDAATLIFAQMTFKIFFFFFFYFIFWIWSPQRQQQQQRQILTCVYAQMWCERLMNIKWSVDEFFLYIHMSLSSTTNLVSFFFLWLLSNWIHFLLSPLDNCA